MYVVDSTFETDKFVRLSVLKLYKRMLSIARSKLKVLCNKISFVSRSVISLFIRSIAKIMACMRLSPLKFISLHWLPGWSASCCTLKSPPNIISPSLYEIAATFWRYFRDHSWPFDLWERILKWWQFDRKTKVK